MELRTIYDKLTSHHQHRHEVDRVCPSEHNTWNVFQAEVKGFLQMTS